MIRLAVPADANAIGTMHAAAWVETYAGLVPGELLAEHGDPARRRLAWARILGEPLMPQNVFLAEEGGEVLGFASVAPARDPALGTEGELTSIYLLRRAQGLGLGTALLGHAFARLRAAGFRSAGAWALETNRPAARFYAARGALPGPRRVEHRGAHALPEIGWIWPELPAPGSVRWPLDERERFRGGQRPPPAPPAATDRRWTRTLRLEMRYDAPTSEDTPVNKSLSASRPNSLRQGPDARGRFGIFGGRFVAETLMPLILEVEKAYEASKTDAAFQAEWRRLLKDYVGRPSPLWYAERMTQHLRAKAGPGMGAKVYLKREDLNHTGAHKINAVLAQILLAKKMGKTRIIAETGAGQHGVATATACALMDLPCVVYMGATDVERQQPNVFRMRLLGAEVVPVTAGAATLKDAMNEALRDWVANVQDTYYCIGTVAGPHPYPAMVRDFQQIIGQESREQMLAAEGRLPDALVAAVGGGSNAMGLFFPFLDDSDVVIYGVEAAGRGLDTEEHAAALSRGRPGVLHGNRTYLLQDRDGQIQEAHSISAGLDYPGVGPEHSWLHEIGRVQYVAATDDEALEAFQLCTKLEGIIPALEPAHALAHVIKLAPTLPEDRIILVNLSGRGDKDIFTVARHLGENI